MRTLPHGDCRESAQQCFGRHEVISQFGMAQEAHQNPASKNRRLNVSLLLRYSPPDGSRVSLPCLVQGVCKAWWLVPTDFCPVSTYSINIHAGSQNPPHRDQRLARRCFYMIMWCWWYQNHLRVKISGYVHESWELPAGISPALKQYWGWI